MRFKLLSSSLITIIFIANYFEAHAANNQQASNVCQHVWKFPPNCLGNCTYQLVWRFKPVEDAIEFIVTSKHAQRWTGVGFALDKTLQNSDAIFAWIEDNSRYVMMDAFLPNYQTPISDKHQSISNISATVSNGSISFRFTRKRNTDDPLEDLLFSDEKCLYIIYPVEGGSVDVKNRAVITDEFAPQISDAPVCIRSCNYKPPPAPPTTTIAPAVSTSAVQVTPAPELPVAQPTTSAPSRFGNGRPRLNFTTSLQQATRPTSTSTTSTTTTTSTSTTTTTTTTPKPAPPKPKTTTTTSTTTTTPKPTTTTTTTTTPRPTTTTTQAPTTTTTTTTTQTPSTSSSSTTSTTTTRPSVTVASESTSSQNSANHQEQLSKAASNLAKLSEETSGDSAGQQWCVGRWSYPANCRFQPRTSAETISYLQQTIDSSTSIRPLPLELSDCSYYAQWKYLDESDSIEFIIQTKTRYKWTGIGFSNGTKMANSDAIIGIFDEVSGRHFIMDTWLEDHVMPKLDAVQSADHTWAKRESGTTTVRFQRKRLTNDPFDFQFTDDSCAYFFFPTQGGAFNAISKRLHRHDVIPSVSKQKICIRSCTKNVNLATTTISADADSSSSSQSPNLLLLSSSTSTSTSTSPSVSSPSSPPITSSGSPSDKNLDSANPINLSPSNDLNAELDSSGSLSSSASTSGQQQTTLSTLATSKSADQASPPNSNPFTKLTFLSEPSIRWLAGIGCVATLLAMIVFQACFTVYKNKQAYKQNLYRQSAFNKQAAACLGHTGPYMTDSGSHHQPSTGSDETQIASLNNNSSSGTRAAASLARPTGQSAVPPPLTIRSHHHQRIQQQQQQQHQQHRHHQYYQQQHYHNQSHHQYPKQHHHHHHQESRQHPHHHHHNQAAARLQHQHGHHQSAAGQQHQHYSNNSQLRQHSQLATAATAGGVPYDLLRHHAHHQPHPPVCDEFTSSQTDYSEQEDDEELEEEVFDEEENYYAARRARLYYN